MDASTREFVRRRAGNRCEYCRLPQEATPFDAFHVEHIIAKQHLDEADSPDNLALACDRCNAHKLTSFVSIDPETRRRADVFNPRTNSWDDHFCFAQDGTVIGLTPTGRATVRLLTR